MTPAATHPVRAVPRRAIVPRATYRVQLHSDFRFADAMALVPYLAALGISHLYASPPLRARPGSRHGYDVVDHQALNPELGTRADFDALVAALHAHSMGLLIDVVPNHMGVLQTPGLAEAVRPPRGSTKGAEPHFVDRGDNAWWLDVLENGAASAFAEFFDIDWRAADPALTGKVLLPVLGDQYGVVLERGELKLAFDAQRGYFTLTYYAHRLPIDPSSYGPLLQRVLRARGAQALPSNEANALKKLIARFDALPPKHTTDTAQRATRQRDKTQLKAQLGALARSQPALAAAIAQVVDTLNGRVGERASFDALDALIDAQAYRLAHWHIAGDEINYRRFFDINELAALQMDRPEVFEATHRLVLGLAASGAVDGLRIDHPDGLADPAGYFVQLQRRYAQLAGLPAFPHDPADPAQTAEEGESPGRQPGTAPDLPLYVVVEKIMATHEIVPAEWTVHGTTGYRFANLVNGLFVDGAAKARLDRVWRAFAGNEAQDFETLSWHCRHVMMDSTLAGELTVLSTRALRLAREDRRTRDFTLQSLRRALAEVVAAFPVYRSYLIDKPSAQDRKYIDWALGRARRRSRAGDAGAYDFLRRVLLGRPLPGAPAGLGERYRQFARRLQQYTSPVAAKGIEDTALYRHQRLVSLNDVGGDPDEFGMSVAAFHHVSRDRALSLPGTMLATSTHDSKRSEDVRLRIDVVSEVPAAWRLTVRRWSRLNRSHKRVVHGERAPSRNDEYLLYQLLIGSLPVQDLAGTLDAPAWADYTDRLTQAMLKSVREAKLLTSWLNPDAAYEAALTGFIQATLARRSGNLFLADLQTTAAFFAWHGALNSLTLAVLKSLSPGVPDFYQGCETQALYLVDPDNRRPVDFDHRRALLADAQQFAAAHLGEHVAAPPASAVEPAGGPALALAAGLRERMAGALDGRAKFWVVWRALQLRAAHDGWLRAAEYLPVEARGERAAHVVAFARRAGPRWLLVVGTRLHAQLAAAAGLPLGQAPTGDAWGDTVLVWPDGDRAAGPQGDWLEDAIHGTRHALRGGVLRLAELLREFPVAALYGTLAQPDDASPGTTDGAAAAEP